MSGHVTNHDDISTLVPSNYNQPGFVFVAQLKKDAHLKQWLGFLDFAQFSGKKFKTTQTKQPLAEL